MKFYFNFQLHNCLHNLQNVSFVKVFQEELLNSNKNLRCNFKLNSSTIFIMYEQLAVYNYCCLVCYNRIHLQQVFVRYQR